MGNRRNIKVFLICLLIAWLTGCGTTGGDVLGLFPAPKFLKGSIENNVYTSKDKLFAIAIPHKQGTYEYKYMRVKEEYTNHNDYVSFISTAFDQSIYRINFTMRATPGSMQPSFDEVAPKFLAASEQQIEQGYKAPTELISSSRTQINGHDAYYWQLKQVVPAGILNSSNPVTLIHDIYFINYSYALATVWVQRPTGPGVPAIKNMLAPDKFAESLTLLPVKTDASRRLTANGVYKFPHDPVIATTPAVLCGLSGMIAYSYPSGGYVDFVAPDDLWQIEGDYSVQVFKISKHITGKQSFLENTQKFFTGYIPKDNELLGVKPELVSTTEIKTLDLPAMQAVGIEKEKDMLVATAELGKTRILVISLLYPINPGEDPNKVFPWQCYNKFLNSVKEQDSVAN